MTEKTASTKQLKWTVPVILIAFAVFAVLSLPRGFEEDLSVIGQGKRVVVLVHDHNYVNSTQLMESLDQVRDEFSEHIEFRVADILKPQGKQFAASHNVEPITLLLFNGDGQKQQTLAGVKPPHKLRQVFADW